MNVNPNILGFDYILLIALLWGLAAIDYQSRSKYGITTKRNINVVRIAFFVLASMAAFRALDITNDTLSYYRMYNAIGNYGVLGVRRIEKGYVYLNYIISWLVRDSETGYHILQILIAAFSYFSVARYIEKNARTYGVCILTFYFLLNGSFMSAMRQSMAIAIVLLGIDLLKNRRFVLYILYILCVFVAAQFHSTAWIALLFIVLYGRKFNKYVMGGIIIAAVIATITNIPALLGPILEYGSIYITNEIGNQTDAIVMSIMYLALLILRILIPKHIISSEDEIQTRERYLAEEKENDFYSFNIVLTLAFTILSLRAPAISRFTQYFLIVGLPYISNTMEIIENKMEAFLIKVVFCLAIFGYSLIALIYRPEWQHLWPYHFFWMK